MKNESNFNINNDIFVERFLELKGEQSSLQFSKVINIPQTTISGWILKQTTPRMEYLIMLAQHFNCTIDYLVGLED